MNRTVERAPRSLVGTVACIGGLLLLGTACGDQRADVESTDRIAGDLESATTASSARFSLVSETPADLPGIELSRTTEGEIDFAADAFHLRTTGETIFDQSADDPNDLSYAEDYEMVLVDAVVYWRHGESGWRSMPVPADMSTNLIGVAGSLAELERLRNGQDGELIGMETVRGTDATHTRYIDNADGHTVDVWLDQHDRVVRYRNTPAPFVPTTTPVSFDSTVVGMTLQGVTTLDFWDFGTPIEIVAPPDAVPCGNECSIPAPPREMVDLPLDD